MAAFWLGVRSKGVRLSSCAAAPAPVPADMGGGGVAGTVELVVDEAMLRLLVRSAAVMCESMGGREWRLALLVETRRGCEG